MAQERRADTKDFSRPPYVTRSQITPDSEVLASLIRLDKYHGPTHAHLEAQVSLIFSDVVGMLSRETKAGNISDQPITSGCVMYFPPNESHCVQWSGFTELLNIYWTDEVIRELADQSGCRLPTDGAEVRLDPTIQAVGQILRDDFLWTGDLSPMIIDNGRALILARMFRTFSQGTRHTAVGLLSRKRLQNAIDAIISSPDRSFTLVELARLCHSSVFHFSRSFTARVGCAPFEFQRQLRVQKAQALLHQTDLSIEQISLAVGVQNPTSFSRLFRKTMGQSPRDFRRSRPIK